MLSLKKAASSLPKCVDFLTTRDLGAVNVNVISVASQSGLFKLLLPLPVANEKGARQEENVLFLLHPKQPLSHVAALIRAELLTADPKHPPADPAGSSPLQSHGTEIDNISFHGRFRDPQDVDAAKSSGRHRLSSKWAMSSKPRFSSKTDGRPYMLTMKNWQLRSETLSETQHDTVISRLPSTPSISASEATTTSLTRFLSKFVSRTAPLDVFFFEHDSGAHKLRRVLNSHL